MKAEYFPMVAFSREESKKILRSNRASMNEFYVLDVLNTLSSLTRSFLTIGDISCDMKIEMTHVTSWIPLKCRPQHLLKDDSWKLYCTLIQLWIKKSWVSSKFIVKLKFQFYINTIVPKLSKILYLQHILMRNCKGFYIIIKIFIEYLAKMALKHISLSAYSQKGL